nr:MAG TPA: hypothetical protein [Caudoviricetes sp.]
MHRRPRHQIKRPPKAPTSDGQCEQRNSLWILDIL